MVAYSIVAYLLLQLGISIWISRKVHSSDDFFVAGRNLGVFILMFSMFATWFGAETCLGTSGEVYSHGLAGSRADPIGYSLCLVLTAVLLVGRLWRSTYTTLADFYKDRYGHIIERMAIIFLVPSSIIWAAAQIRAFGQIISVTTHVDVYAAMGLAFAFVTLYTLFGGLLGDIYTDLIQGITMMIGLCIIFYFALQEISSWESWFSTLKPHELALMKPGELIWERMDRWAIPVLGSLVSQEIASRVFAARSMNVAKAASYCAALIYLIIGVIPVMLGLMGKTLMPDLTNSEQYLILLAQSLLPTVGFVIFTGALVSAILATIDSILISSSALITHNLVSPFFNIKTEKNKLLIGRFFVLCCGSIAFLLAYKSSGIYDLVEEASSYGTAGVFVITLVGLYSKWGGPWPAGVALVIGALAVPTAKYAAVAAPFLLTLAITFLGYFLCTFLQYLYKAWYQPSKIL